MGPWVGWAGSARVRRVSENHRPRVRQKPPVGSRVSAPPPRPARPHDSRRRRPRRRYPGNAARSRHRPTGRRTGRRTGRPSRRADVCSISRAAPPVRRPPDMVRHLSGDQVGAADSPGANHNESPSEGRPRAVVHALTGRRSRLARGCFVRLFPGGSSGPSGGSTGAPRGPAAGVCRYSGHPANGADGPVRSCPEITVRWCVFRRTFHR